MQLGRRMMLFLCRLAQQHEILIGHGSCPRTAQYLRERGHNAVHLREQGLQHLPDIQIVAKAVAEQRIILTHDLDFGRIVALSRERAPSVVTFRLDDMRAGAVNRHLDELVTRFATELEGGVLISVTDQGVRVRRLPAR